MRVSGLILAGGQGRRMQGHDKGWVKLGSTPMIEWVIHRLAPQVDTLIINANRNLDRYQTLGTELIEDRIKGFQGPLAGIYSGLAICRTRFLVCVPCDCPFFPEDLVKRLLQTQNATNADVVSVSDTQRTHPVFALIKTELKDDLLQYLQSGQRKIDTWYDQHKLQWIEYPAGKNYFDNINTPEQLQTAERRLDELT